MMIQPINDELFAALESVYAAAETVVWTFSPKTYEFIKLARNFPIPTRKLRKCKLRRIAERKKLFRAHRARVNAAILARVRAGGAA